MDFFYTSVKVIGKNSIPTHRTVLFVFPVQSQTRSLNVVKFSVGRKYIITIEGEKLEIIAVILTTVIISMTFS